MFVISDQCFPPPLTPPEGPGGCLAILQVEDATLLELSDYFIKIMGYSQLPTGTVILIMSGSHLANNGSQQYAVDLIASVNYLKRFLPPGSFVTHGPLLFSCGLNDMGTVRAISDICH